MNDRTLVAISAVVGAAVGGLAGFLLFTERGRRLRADLESGFASFASEAQKLQDSVARTTDTVNEGWRRIGSLVEEAGQTVAAWSADGEPTRH